MTQKPDPVNKQLLSRLTHHVRNPFNGIIGFTDLLVNHFDKHSDDDIRKYVQIVHQLSKKALLRSENLAWWLKFYTNNLAPVFQDMDVSDIVKEELSYFGTEIDKQQLDVQFEKGDSNMIYSDKVMLQSIIRNVMSNIIEFTPPGESVDIKLYKAGTKLTLTFSNTFKEQPTEETLAFINALGNKEITSETMPDNPGLWCIKMLGTKLNLNLAIQLKSNSINVSFGLN